jgi:hypothetical protein
VRDIPDVSFFSGSFMSDDGYSQDFNAAWSVCSDNTVNGDTDAYSDCVPKTGTTGCNGTCAISTNTSTTPIGGTSTSAPSMAGILALVIQHQGGQRLGQADYGIYNLAATKPADFHDITTGNNSVLCTAGTVNCGTNGFIDGYNAGAGYDLASGIGSIDVAKFVNDWSSIQFATTTTTLTAGTSASSLGTSPLTIAHGTTIYLKVAVSPATATGNVVLTTNSTQENSDSITTAPITNGVATFSTQALPGGTYTLYARYGGDTTNAAGQSQGIQVTVSSETSALQFNLNVYNAQTGALTATSPSSAVYGSQISADITPYGGTEGLTQGSPATGTVVLTQDGVQLGTITLNSEGQANYQLSPVLLTPGVHSFSAAYSGGGSYNASTTTQTITITKAVMSGYFGLPANGQVYQTAVADQYVTIFMTGYSNGVAPTGTFTFTMNGASAGSGTGVPFKGNGTISAPLSDVGVTIGQALTPGQIPIGTTATITANYSGDSNYAAAGPFTITVSVAEAANAAFTLAAAGPVNIATPGQPGTAILSATPTNGFGGSVTLSCALTGGAATVYAPTCSIPASVSISGTAAQTVTVTISTVGATTASLKHPSSLFVGLSGGGLALASMLFFAFPNRRRRSVWMASLAILLTVLLPTTGCGSKTGSGSGGGGATGTPAGSYTFTITGTHGSITNSTMLTVVVV